MVNDEPMQTPSPNPKANPNRRKFIKQAGTLSAGAALASQSSLWLPRVQSQETKRLGYALVGLGGLSTHQIAPGLQKTQHSYLAGIVSGTPSKIKARKARKASGKRLGACSQRIANIVSNKNMILQHFLACKY